MEDDIKLRFKDAIWNKAPRLDITIGGVGGIGSWLSLYLSRIDRGYIYMYDDDVIEKHNLGGQLYLKTHIGSSKVDGMIELLDHFGSDINHIETFEERIVSDTGIQEPICFSCFDNMEARKVLFDIWINNYNRASEEDKKNYLFIDGRLLAEQYQVYIVTPDRAVEYRKTLFNDSEVSDEGVCSYKQTSHFAAMIAARMAQAYTNFLANLVQEDTYELPFFIQEEGPSFMVEIKDFEKNGETSN